MDLSLVPNDPRYQAYLPQPLTRRLASSSRPYAVHFPRQVQIPRPGVARRTNAIRPTNVARPPVPVPTYRPRRRKLRDNIMGITKPAIRRLARRGGVYMMKAEIYDEVRKILRGRLEEIIRIAILVIETPDYPGHYRKMITTGDITYALRKLGTPVWGFGDVRGNSSAFRRMSR